MASNVGILSLRFTFSKTWVRIPRNFSDEGIICAEQTGSSAVRSVAVQQSLPSCVHSFHVVMCEKSILMNSSAYSDKQT